MTIVATDAILLKKTELRETSLLLDFYTKESGKIKGVLKGIRSPQPQFGALFEVFTLDRILFYERKNKDIFIISQCELIDFFPNLRKDLEKLGYAFYYTELIDSALGSGERNEEIFNLLLDSLRFLSQPGSAKRITRVFEIKLLKALGMMPRLNRCINCQNDILPGNARFSIKDGGVLCNQCFKIDVKAKPVLAGTLNFIDRVAETPMERVSRIKVSKDVGKGVESILRDFLNFHIDKRFKTIGFMQEVGVL